ncbi:hypothetical protein LGQ02_09450 [Bacillus shivajii]|uniref:hypothetical protein n=1 Tax=Bacillus shivajii TaxID=1983719 RepID=UPI001CFB4A12|nr:hypothetical protein [Bacillus shivajii]UCZ54946.1 hypothetical protein LGQ02_09450 [Bacillus shivajii]
MIYEKLKCDYKPSYAANLESRLHDTGFLQQYGNIIQMILDSNEYWNKLRQRVDFLVYSYVLHYNEAAFCPKEGYSLYADWLFESIEEEIKGLRLNIEEILIDELFREFTRRIKGKFIYSDDSYEYFTAPYFNDQIYYEGIDQGTLYLDQLTEDLFDEALEELICKIQVRMSG